LPKYNILQSIPPLLLVAPNIERLKMNNLEFKIGKLLNLLTQAAKLIYTY
jgi:hypothetical protein